MTFDDDYLCIETPVRRVNVSCQSLGIEWPPPERIEFNDAPYTRVSYSAITDEQRQGMTHVCRGALYQPVLH